MWLRSLSLAGAMLAISTAAMALPGAQGVGATPVPPELQSYVTKFTGPQPADCGQHLLVKPFAPVNVDELQRSLTCVFEAARNRKAFWTVKQDQGIDSLVFQGLVGTTDGVVHRFFYDSAPCGGPGCAGRFTTERCEKPTVVSERGFARFECAR